MSETYDEIVSLVERWKVFVQENEQGYTMCRCEYENDASFRIRLEEELMGTTSDELKELRQQVRELDRRYEQVTRKLENSPWDEHPLLGRVPLNPIGDLAEDISWL